MLNCVVWVCVCISLFLPICEYMKVCICVYAFLYFCVHVSIWNFHKDLSLHFAAAFLTDVSNSDAVKTYNSSRGHKSTVSKKTFNFSLRVVFVSVFWKMFCLLKEQQYKYISIFYSFKFYFDIFPRSNCLYIL